MMQQWKVGILLLNEAEVLDFAGPLKYFRFPQLRYINYPGGYGAEEIEIHNDVVLNWIKEEKPKVSLMTSEVTDLGIKGNVECNVRGVLSGE